jgi:hypothetical protein
MKKQIVQLLKFFIPKFILFQLSKYKKLLSKKVEAKKQLKAWYDKGCPVPPPHIVKKMTIRAYQKKFKAEILVETGTFTGEMVEAQKKIFRKIFSIELGTELYNSAVKRFANEKHINILHGDSGMVLNQLIPKIDKPVIFWLDGHYSGGITAKGEKNCPILEELDAIFKMKKLNHVLLIDDARCFTGDDDYPTINQLEAYVKNKDRNYSMEVKDDIIRFTVQG